MHRALGLLLWSPTTVRIRVHSLRQGHSRLAAAKRLPSQFRQQGETTATALRYRLRGRDPVDHWRHRSSLPAPSTRIPQLVPYPTPPLNKTGHHGGGGRELAAGGCLCERPGGAAQADLRVGHDHLVDEQP